MRAAIVSALAQVPGGAGQVAQISLRVESLPGGRWRLDATIAGREGQGRRQLEAERCAELAEAAALLAVIAAAPEEEERGSAPETGGQETGPSGTGGASQQPLSNESAGRRTFTDWPRCGPVSSEDLMNLKNFILSPLVALALAACQPSEKNPDGANTDSATEGATEGDSDASEASTEEPTGTGTEGDTEAEALVTVEELRSACTGNPLEPEPEETPTLTAQALGDGKVAVSEPRRATRAARRARSASSGTRATPCWCAASRTRS